MARKVYLAGPLYTPQERAARQELAHALREQGYEVFVPEDQFLIGKEFVPRRHPEAFASDIAGLLDCDTIVAILNGPQVDDGTAGEIGVFYGLCLAGKKKRSNIFGLCEDIRFNEQIEGINTFVLEMILTEGYVATSVPELLREMKRRDHGQ